MKLKQFISNECANWHDGRCLGVTPLNERFQPEGPCQALLGRECKYFKNYVAPVAEWCEPVGTKHLRMDQAEAIREYEDLVASTPIKHTPPTPNTLK